MTSSYKSPRASGRALLVLALTAAGCTEQPYDPGVVAPQFAKPAGDPGAGLTFDESAGAGFRILSDGGSASILGLVTPASYANGECSVSAHLNITELIADIGTASKLPRGCVKRGIRFTLDTPEAADGTPGGPVFGTVQSSVHIKLQRLLLVTAQTGPALIDGGFNQLVGTGDCSYLRFNRNFSSDELLVTRTRTHGAGNDRNEWRVETRPSLDRAACLNANSTVLRYYRLPFRMTVTQLTY